MADVLTSEAKRCDPGAASTAPSDDTRFLAMLIRQGMKLIVVGIEKRYGLDEKRDKAA